MQSYGGGASANPNAILDECREVDRALDDRVQARLWVERLPSGADGVAPVLAALCE